MIARNCVLPGTETRQLFCRMFVTLKIKELFAFTLNGIATSVSCVSSMIVVVNAKFARFLAAHANKKDGEKTKKPDQSDVFC